MLFLGLGMHTFEKELENVGNVTPPKKRCFENDDVMRLVSTCLGRCMSFYGDPFDLETATLDLTS